MLSPVQLSPLSVDRNAPPPNVAVKMSPLKLIANAVHGVRQPLSTKVQLSPSSVEINAPACKRPGENVSAGINRQRDNRRKFQAIVDRNPAVPIIQRTEHPLNVPAKMCPTLLIASARTLCRRKSIIDFGPRFSNCRRTEKRRLPGFLRRRSHPHSWLMQFHRRLGGHLFVPKSFDQFAREQL